MSGKPECRYNLILEILSTIGVRTVKEEIIEAFSLNDEWEDFFSYGKECDAFRIAKDGKIDTMFSYIFDNENHDSKSEILLMYAKLISVLIANRKLEWSNLEIERLILKFNEQGFDSQDALIVSNLTGKCFEESKDFETAIEIYRIGSLYCDKNNLSKDIFVDCVLNLSRVQFLRGITSLETVKLQERALELVSNRNSTYNDAILMVYTGINQTNIYRDADGFEMRSKGLRLLEQFDDSGIKDEFMFVKAWSYSWSGEVEKIISLYEDLIVLIEKNQIDTMSPFMYLPIIFGYFYLGEFSKALVISEILYKHAMEEKDLQAAAMMLSVLGRCHVYLNNLDIAESLLYKALEEASQIEYNWAKYYTLIALAFLHFKRKNVVGCIDALELSDNLSKENNLGNIQNSPFILDIFKFIDESGKPCSLQNYETKVNFVLQSTSRLMRGVALRHDAERKINGNYTPEEIINTFNQSIRLLTKVGSPIEIGYSQMSLARYLLAIGNKESASKYAQRAYENLYIADGDSFSSELLSLVNRNNDSVNIKIKLEILALELRHILDKEKMMARMIASLEKILQAECGAVVEYHGKKCDISFKENIVNNKAEADYKDIFADCAFAKETRKIFSFCKTYDYKVETEQKVLLSLLQSPSFKVAIPILQSDGCSAVMYIESYLRDVNLAEDEKNALLHFAESIADHFYALAAEEAVQNETAKVFSLDGKESQEEFFSSTNSEIVEIEKLIERVGMTDVPVLITGETGVGKEYFAKKVFQNSRYKKKFIKVNCGAIPESLLESELFGYEKGSFTGASHTKIGYFEAANGGTVFLDEIGELPLYAQTKLLRVLQEKTIMRVGSVVETKVDFRLIAATNRDLKKEVENGTFRQDLYYRINLIPLTIPALRERKNDIIDFAKFFLERFSSELGMENCVFSEQSLRWLLDYSWPGNVRELENVIHRAVLMTNSPQIDIQPVRLEGTTESGTQKIETLEEVERKHIIKVLDYCNGRIGGQGGAAELLGMKRTTLNSRIEKLGIKKYNQ